MTVREYDQESLRRFDLVKANRADRRYAIVEMIKKSLSQEDC